MFRLPVAPPRVAILFVCAASMLPAACTNTGESLLTAFEAPVLPGQEIAQRLCSGCHAIGREGASPHPDSLPFRQISMHYPVRSLEEALAEGIFVGHPDMPPFQFEPRDIDDLLDYIEAIQDPV